MSISTKASNRFAVLRNLSFTPFDTSTEEGREKERNRRATLNAIGNLCEFGITALNSILAVSLTIGYLGKTLFGIWMTITSFAALLSFMDLGIGNALVRSIAVAQASDDHDELRRAVTGGLGIITLIGAVASVGFAVLSWFLPWGRLFHLAPGEAATTEAVRHAVVIFAFLFGFSLLSGAVRKVYQGLQQAYIGHFTAIAATAISLVAMATAAYLHLSVVWLVCLSFGIIQLLPLLLLVPLYRQGTVAIHGMLEAMREASPHLLRTGGMFIIVQIGVLITFGSESTLIGFIAGPASVALYVVAQRPFQYVALPIRVLSNAVWGAYADANARGDRAYLRATLKKQMIIAGVWSIVGVGLMALVPRPLVGLWTHHLVEVSWQLTVPLAIWMVFETFTSPLAIFMNGCGNVRPQAAATVSTLFTFFPLKVYALYRWGINGMVVLNAITVPLNAVIYYGIIYRRSIFAPLRDT